MAKEIGLSTLVNGLIQTIGAAFLALCLFVLQDTRVKLDGVNLRLQAIEVNLATMRAQQDSLPPDRWKQRILNNESRSKENHQAIEDLEDWGNGTNR